MHGQQNIKINNLNSLSVSL